MGSPQPRHSSLSRRGKAAEAERIVADWLVRRGYTIVAVNLRIGYLEIDIVARLGTLIAVVEVRQRAAHSYTTAFGSIGFEKRRRVRRAAERLWSRRYAKDSTVENLRIDAATVSFGASGVRVEYSAGAF